MNGRFFLILSLGCNLLAGAALIYRVQGKRETVSAAANSAAPAAQQPRQPAQAGSIAKPAPAPSTARFNWQQIESADYPVYIANLRAIGCPEDTIRDIIVADVNKLFEARRKEARKAVKKWEYWKGGSPMAFLQEDETSAKLRELGKEKRALLKHLLGIEVEDKAELAAMMNPLESLLDFLPSSKVAQLMEFEQGFAAKQAKTLTGRRGTPDVQAIASLEKQKREELAKILTPQELEDYELRMSPSAMALRASLGKFEVSETEFREMFRARQQFDEAGGGALAGMLGGASGDATSRAARQKELDAETQALLGTDRYREYKHEQTWSNSSLQRISEEFQIPKATALMVYDVRLTAQEQAAQVKRDTGMGEEQRRAALDGIRSEVEKEVTRILGPAAATAYVQQGSWIKNLNSAGSSSQNQREVRVLPQPRVPGGD